MNSNGAEGAKWEKRRNHAISQLTVLVRGGEISQKDIAREVGVHESSVSYWLSGEKWGPSAPALMGLERFLRRSQAFYGTENADASSPKEDLVAACAAQKEVEDVLKDHGEFIRRTRHGRLYRVAGAATVLVSDHESDGDSRKWKNVLAELRRALRKGGISVPVEPKFPQGTYLTNPMLDPGAYRRDQKKEKPVAPNDPSKIEEELIFGKPKNGAMSPPPPAARPSGTQETDLVLANAEDLAKGKAELETLLASAREKVAALDKLAPKPGTGVYFKPEATSARFFKAQPAEVQVAHSECLKRAADVVIKLLEDRGPAFASAEEIGAVAKPQLIAATFGHMTFRSAAAAVVAHLERRGIELQSVRDAHRAGIWVREADGFRLQKHAKTPTLTAPKGVKTNGECLWCPSRKVERRGVCAQDLTRVFTLMRREGIDYEQAEERGWLLPAASERKERRFFKGQPAEVDATRDLMAKLEAPTLPSVGPPKPSYFATVKQVEVRTCLVPGCKSREVEEGLCHPHHVEMERVIAEGKATREALLKAGKILPKKSFFETA